MKRRSFFQVLLGTIFSTKPAQSLLNGSSVNHIIPDSSKFFPVGSILTIEQQRESLNVFILGNYDWLVGKDAELKFLNEKEFLT